MPTNRPVQGTGYLRIKASAESPMVKTTRLEVRVPGWKNAGRIPPAAM